MDRFGREALIRRQRAAVKKSEPKMPKGLGPITKHEWKLVTDLLRTRGVLDALDETPADRLHNLLGDAQTMRG